MKFIDTITDFVSSWEKKDFYLYMGLSIGFFVLFTVGLMWYSQYKIGSLNQQIEDINEWRQKNVKPILERAREVENHRKEVDRMLAQEKDFKIAGYFNKLLTDSHIFDKKELGQTSQTERDGYKEDTLNLRLRNMNMQELTELLQEIEKNPRIYSKSLEIKKSSTKADAIDVSITIATLLSKTESGK